MVFVSYCRLCCFFGWIVSYWLDRIAVLYRIGWIDWIRLAGLYWIVSYRLDEGTSAFMHWLVTARCLDGTDGTGGTDGLDGVLVGLGWDGRPLVPAGTGAPEQERHHWFLRGRDALAGYCQHGTDGTDGLDGALV